MLPEAARSQLVGLTPKAISGCSAAMASMPSAAAATSTTFGGSTLSRMNGLGRAEAARSAAMAASPAYMARWEVPALQMPPEAATQPTGGQTAMAISGSSEAMASIQP